MGRIPDDDKDFFEDVARHILETRKRLHQTYGAATYDRAKDSLWNDERIMIFFEEDAPHEHDGTLEEIVCNRSELLRLVFETAADPAPHDGHEGVREYFNGLKTRHDEFGSSAAAFKQALYAVCENVERMKAGGYRLQ